MHWSPHSSVVFSSLAAVRSRIEFKIKLIRNAIQGVFKTYLCDLIAIYWTKKLRSNNGLLVTQNMKITKTVIGTDFLSYWY